MTQKQKIIHRLNTHGEVGRNWAVDLPYKDKILRLGAIVNRLKKEGWVFTAHYQQTENGKDYVYKVVQKRIPNMPTPFFKPFKIKEKPEPTNQGELL